LSEARIQVLDLAVRLACERARQTDFKRWKPTSSGRETATREGELLDRVECSR